MPAEILAPPTKKAPMLQAPMSKWRATMRRLMSSPRPMPKGKFPNGLEWHGRYRLPRRARPTFLNAFLESNGRQRRPRQLRFAVVFNNQCRSNEQ